MIKMLKRGRLDVIYEDQAVIEYLLKKLDYREDSIKLATDMGPDELWIGFHRPTRTQQNMHEYCLTG